MARPLLILMNYVFLLFLSKTMFSFCRKERATRSCKGHSCRSCLITDITIYNMNTTIYWKSKFSHQDTTIQYDLQYNYDDSANWTSVPCPRPQWHNDSGQMSCGLLTCATTKDEFYEIRVMAHGNSSGGFVTPCSVFHPTERNIPSRITDVNITRNSSTSTISWRLPADFCPKSKYCMKFKYHKHGEKKNKSHTVQSQTMNSTFLTGLDPCANYLFYLAVHKEGLCSESVAAHWTTGPFLSPGSQNPVVYDTPTTVLVLNFNTTVHWRQPQSCSLEPTQFSVFYRSAELSQNWSRSTCSIEKDVIRNVFSCEFLTCTVTKDQAYEVQVRIGGSSGRPKNVLFFQPSLENIPNQISNVNITALTSTSLRVAWELAPFFCTKFSYCLTFFHHGDSENAENKSVDVSDQEQNQQSIVVHNLLPYTKYYFYATTFRPGLGCLYLFQAEYSHGATGPFTETTLEDVPSSSPVLICSLCDVIVHGRTRTGTVRWQLPPKDKWNGLPRVFIIQWREKTNENISVPIWNNKTIFETLPRESNLTGLFINLEYVVRVKMCNSWKLCSKFSKEMTIEIVKQKVAESKTTSHSTIAISLGVTFAVIALLCAIILYLKHKRSRLRSTSSNVRASVQLPSLECLSYENISPMTMPTYSQLSPTDDCYPLQTPEPERKSEHSSPPEEDTTSTSRTLTATDIL